jgi:hypothetical protein
MPLVVDGLFVCSTQSPRVQHQRLSTMPYALPRACPPQAVFLSGDQYQRLTSGCPDAANAGGEVM